MKNETIERLENIKSRIGWDGYKKDCSAIDKVIQALEELQQYKAIGTVEEIKSFFNENRKAGYKHGYSDGYTKGIDEFAEKIFEVCKYIPKSYVMALAEQMKAGGKNE